MSAADSLSWAKPAIRTHLQYEDEIVHWLVPVEEVVLGRPLVLLVVFQLLDDIRVLQQAQQNLFRHLQRCERLNLWGHREGSVSHSPSRSREKKRIYRPIAPIG